MDKKIIDLIEKHGETISGMIEYCLDNEIRMGMDGGWTTNDKPTKERSELKKLVKLLYK